MPASVSLFSSSEPRGRRRAQALPVPGSSLTSNGWNRRPAVQDAIAGCASSVWPFDVALVSNRAGVIVPLPNPDAWRRTRRASIAALAPEQSRAAVPARIGTPLRAGTAELAAAFDCLQEAAYRLAHTVSLPLFPLPGSIAVIDPTDPRTSLPVGEYPAMSMKESRAHELALSAQEIRRAVMRVFVRDGVVDEEELAILQDLTTHEDGLTEKAEDELLAVGLFRRGRRSDHVQRLGRQIPPDDRDCG